MSSQQLPAEGGAQYDRLVIVMAELRERGRRVLAEARRARAVSSDLRATLSENGDPLATPGTAQQTGPT